MRRYTVEESYNSTKKNRSQSTVAIPIIPKLIVLIELC